LRWHKTTELAARTQAAAHPIRPAAGFLGEIRAPPPSLSLSPTRIRIVIQRNRNPGTSLQNRKNPSKSRVKQNTLPQPVIPLIPKDFQQKKFGASTCLNPL
jgi:hypothetical protein